MDNNLIFIVIMLVGLLINIYGYFQLRTKIQKDNLKTYIKKYNGFSNGLLGLFVCFIGAIEFCHSIGVEYSNLPLIRYILIAGLILSLLVRFYFIFFAYKKFNNRNKVIDYENVIDKDGFL